VNEATAALKTHREMVQAKIQNANVLQARKVACIATVNSLFQVLFVVFACVLECIRKNKIIGAQNKSIVQYYIA
jgi:hypothetical protein